MVKKKQLIKASILAFIIGISHIGLHFLGMGLGIEPYKNFFYFVTSGLMILTFFYFFFIEDRIT